MLPLVVFFGCAAVPPPAALARRHVVTSFGQAEAGRVGIPCACGVAGLVHKVAMWRPCFPLVQALDSACDGDDAVGLVVVGLLQCMIRRAPRLRCRLGDGPLAPAFACVGPGRQHHDMPTVPGCPQFNDHNARRSKDGP